MAEEKKKERKKKKERMDINLPNARRSMRRSREMKQMRTGYEDWWKLLGGVIAVLLIVFVLLGGINQGAALKALSEFVQNLGEKIAKFFEGGSLDANENGIYWRP